MQDLIKRYFWLLGGVVVVICAVFVAKASGHIVEAKFLGDAEHGPKITPVMARPDTPTVTVRSKDGAPLAARNTAAVITSRNSCTVSVVVSMMRVARSRISASANRSSRMLSATLAPLSANG